MPSNDRTAAKKGKILLIDAKIAEKREKCLFLHGKRMKQFISTKF